MQEPTLKKSALLMLALVVLAVLAWEIHLRQNGYDLSYFDDPALWSHKRDMVYEDPAKATVFIGSSRIKFDLDIDYWEKNTGNHAIQLAAVGSTPIPILEHLAADENFKGRLVVDVTEGLFFSSDPGNAYRPIENMAYYKDRTPAQRAGFYINYLLESVFVFLDKENLALNVFLEKLPIENRKGVFQFPNFPDQFGRVMFNRQEYMTNAFVADTAQRNIVKGIWDGFRKASKTPPASGLKLDTIVNCVKTATNKIKARGGTVLFVRTPSSGPMLIGEGMGFPREKYWNRILQATGCPGIHFADYEAIRHFECPENSHLSMSDARLFTKEFIRILSTEQGWKFNSQNSSN